MFKKLVIASACAVAVLMTTKDACAHGRRGGCGGSYGGYGYSAPVRSYYRAPSYGYQYGGYGGSFANRSSISIGVGGSPFGYRSGFGSHGPGGFGGYPGYGYGRSGVSIGFGRGFGW